jgi:hypothetical protein
MVWSYASHQPHSFWWSIITQPSHCSSRWQLNAFAEPSNSQTVFSLLINLLANLFILYRYIEKRQANQPPNNSAKRLSRSVEMARSFHGRAGLCKGDGEGALKIRNNGCDWWLKHQSQAGEMKMKFTMIALATAFALSSTFALAQSSGSGGGSGGGSAGGSAGASGGATVNSTGSSSGSMPGNSGTSSDGTAGTGTGISTGTTGMGADRSHFGTKPTQTPQSGGTDPNRR